MARYIELTPNKTYASVENAKKAVEKTIPHELLHQTYFVHRQESTGRYFPVFIGERAITGLLHFHFNVVA